MPRWHYSAAMEDEARMARAVARDVPVSPKKMYIVARAIKGMNLQKARELLERVVRKEEPLPTFRVNGKQAHKRGLAAKWGIPMGRYPVKAAKYMLKLLQNVENNAEQKDLDLARLKIVHVAVHPGPILKRYMPRAFGRSTPKFRRLSHVEIMVKEV